ncbi:unnamed protein product [Strongylus vulgaris]|uniref:Uncharacterized protein n=1 Tax=Strongylus vulgaris TaxID=40348 RepID=A0A3P7J8H8_STRVU|nr:unnamed protein product [Strongylus vulgaris]
MTVSTAVNFAAMVYQFGCKVVNQHTEISALDIVNLVVAAQNMYSCCMSPKSARAMLEKVRVEIQAENQNKVLTKEKEIKKAQEKNKIMEQELKEMKASGSGDTKKLEDKIETNNKNIEILRKEAQEALEQFMENQRNWAEADVKEILAPFRESQTKIKNMQNEIKLLKEELQVLENSGSGDTNRIDELRNKILCNEERIDQLTSEALAKQDQYLKNKGEKMKVSCTFEFLLLSFIKREHLRQSTIHVIW